MNQNGRSKRKASFQKVLAALCEPQPSTYIVCPHCLGHAHLLGEVVANEHAEEGDVEVTVREFSVCLSAECGLPSADLKGRELWFGKRQISQALYVPRRAANTA